MSRSTTPLIAAHRTTARIAVGLAALASAGCTWLAPSARARLATTLDAASAAWAAADAVRHAFPGADPVPQHAFAPAVRLAPGRFAVHVGRSDPDGYRLALNGRLSPPVRPPGTRHGLTASTFHPAAASGRVGPGEDAATLWIEATPDGGAEIELRLRGAARNHPVARRLRATLAVAEAVQRAAEALAALDARSAAKVAEQGLAGDLGAAHEGLVAELRLHQALAWARSTDLTGARAAAVAALDVDPRSQRGRAMLLRLDARLAREEAVALGLAAQALTPGAPQVAHAAGMQLGRERARASAKDRGAALRAAARAWMERDPLAGLSWARLALRVDPAHPQALPLLAAAYRAAGEREREREALLAAVAEHAESGELASELAQVAGELGHAGLARLWRERAGGTGVAAEPAR